MPYFTYVLISPSGKTYVGQTDNPSKRLSQHNAGICRTTSREKGWKILHLETFAARREAILRERWFKTGVGRDYIKRLRQNESSAGS